MRTYSKLHLFSTRVETSLPIHIDGPFTSSAISVPNPTQAAANILSVEDTPLSFSLDFSTASLGEFGCFSDQNSSLKPIAANSLLKEFNLAVSDLTPRKVKLYQRIRRKESALCKLRQKYRSTKLKDLCDVDSDTLMKETSNCLNAEAVRLLAAIVRNSRHKLKGRRWNIENKNWLCLHLSAAQNPIFFFRRYSLFHQDATFNPSTIPLILGQASVPMFFMHFVTLCRKRLKKTGTGVSCLMKC
jgi:hypothetical protein